MTGLFLEEDNVSVGGVVKMLYTTTKLERMETVKMEMNRMNACARYGVEE